MKKKESSELLNTFLHLKECKCSIKLRTCEELRMVIVFIIGMGKTCIKELFSSCLTSSGGSDHMNLDPWYS